MSSPESLIAHLDPQLIVTHKPAGLLSVPGRGPDKQDCLIARVQALHPEALVVHRLDMATSGLLLLARGPEMQRALSAAFAGREVHKSYEAVVHGLLVPPAEDWGLIDLPLLTDWPNRPKQKVCFDTGKPSQTRYRVLAQDTLTGTTRVELEPLTGRTHQLRMHMLALGHAIVGDALYALEKGGAGQDPAPHPRLLLHATGLALRHPVTGAALRFSSPAPF